MQRPDNVEKRDTSTHSVGMGRSAGPCLLLAGIHNGVSLSLSGRAAARSRALAWADDLEIGRHRLLMKLAASVPPVRIQANALPGFIKAWLQRHGLDASGSDLWRCHSRRPPDLGICRNKGRPCDASPARAFLHRTRVLRRYSANMSSPHDPVHLEYHWDGVARPKTLRLASPGGPLGVRAWPLRSKLPCFKTTMTPERPMTSRRPPVTLVQSAPNQERADGLIFDHHQRLTSCGRNQNFASSIRPWVAYSAPMKMPQDPCCCSNRINR